MLEGSRVSGEVDQSATDISGCWPSLARTLRTHLRRVNQERMVELKSNCSYFVRYVQ